MKKKINMDDWKELYETATRIKELKPWEKFWDVDLIGVQNGKEEDTVFYSILGRNEYCYGIVVYEGYEGLNSFMLQRANDQLNLSVENIMYLQKNLICYWGNREELNTEQRNIIKELGYHYRGKNQWLYFLSFEPGYCPYNLNEDEVKRMSEYFKDLELALQCYEKIEKPVNFDNGEIFYLNYGQNKKTYTFGAKPLPLDSYKVKVPAITDEKLISDLKNVPKCNQKIEMDLIFLDVTVNDKQYKKPANPAACVIADTSTGMILQCEIQEPETDINTAIVNALIKHILQYGSPKEIWISNMLLEAVLEQVCKICGIRIRKMRYLDSIKEFKRSMKHLYH